MKLGNLVQDRWVEGDGEGKILTSAVNGEPVAAISSKGLDFAAMLEYAKRVGGDNLRKLTFHERGDMLKALAIYLNEHKQEFYALSLAINCITQVKVNGTGHQHSFTSRLPESDWGFSTKLVAKRALTESAEDRHYARFGCLAER